MLSVLVTLFFISLALSIGAFAVSLCIGSDFFSQVQNRVRFFFFLLIVLLFSWNVHTVSATNTGDTATIILLNQKAAGYINNDPVQAESYAQSALKLSVNNGYEKGVATSLNLLGNIYNAKGDYLNAMQDAQKAVQIYLKIDDKQGIASANNNLGFIYANIGNYDRAMEYYGKALEQFRKINYDKGTSSALLNIGNVFENRENHLKALEYYELSLQIKQKNKDTIGIIRLLSNIGNSYSADKDYKNALKYFNDALSLSQSIHNKSLAAFVLGNIGMVYKNLHQHGRALSCLSKAVRETDNTFDKKGQGEILFYTGDVYFDMAKFRDALEYYNKSLDISGDAADINLKLKIYNSMASAYARLNDFKDAYDYSIRYSELHRELLSQEQKKKAAQVEAGIESEKNEYKLALLTKDNELQKSLLSRNRIVLLSVSVLFVLVLAVVLIIFIFNRKRQKLISEQRMQREIQRQTIETEEKERKYFAEELHDGLGPLLSGIKLCVQEIKPETLENPGKEKTFKLVEEMTEEAMISVKNISNKLMPHILNNYGIKVALENFINKIAGREISFSLNSTLTKRYNTTVEIILYRVVSELINNTLKHASAKNISISLLEENNKLVVEYSDDGKGFDFKEKLLSSSSGFGLRNIVSRVQSISGTVDFSGESRIGTNVKIKLPLAE